MAIAKEKEETESHEEWIDTAACTAMALQSIRLFQSLLQSIAFFFFAHPPLPVYIYHSRSISNRYGSLLSAVAMGLNIPSGVTVRPTQGNEIGQPLDSYLPVPPYALHGSNVANEALTLDHREQRK